MSPLRKLLCEALLFVTDANQLCRRPRSRVHHDSKLGSYVCRCNTTQKTFRARCWSFLQIQLDSVKLVASGFSTTICVHRWHGSMRHINSVLAHVFVHVLPPSRLANFSNRGIRREMSAGWRLMTGPNQISVSWLRDPVDLSSIASFGSDASTSAAVSSNIFLQNLLACQSVAWRANKTKTSSGNPDSA